MRKQIIPFEIKLSDGTQKVPDWIQIMKVGDFKHPEYGNFKITPAMLSEMEANFKNHVRRVDLAVDYFHENEKVAAGWFSDVQVRDNALWGRVDWTPRAQQMLADRELRYFSPEWTEVYEDPETGEKFKNVLFGGGLTNRPFLKEMQPIVNHEKGEFMTLEETKAQLADLQKKLSDAQAANTDLQKKCDDMAPMVDDKDKIIEQLKAELEALKAQLAQQDAEMNKAKEEKLAAEKEMKFTKLLTEGKAVPAQKDAFMKDDFMKFAELAQPLNLSAQGGAAPQVQSGELTDEKTLELAEAKRKENDKLTFGEAVALVRREHRNKGA